MRRFWNELALGARLALTGGADARWRAVLTAGGVTLGVALLLAASSVPSMVHRHDRRTAAMQVEAAADPGRDRTQLLEVFDDTSLHGTAVAGMALQATGPHPPLPPGVDRIPGPGQMVVSPALGALLRAPAGAELARRLHARVVGTIGNAGLTGPADLRFYRGAAGLRERGATRVLRFGGPGSSSFDGPIGTLLVILMAVALLLPIGVFVATASRFGSEQRNVRLAAMRLIGADRAATARIAAGESLFGAVAGVVLGCLLFLVVRIVMGNVEIAGISVFTADVRPVAWLAVLVLLVVPTGSVLVTLATMRRVAIEPLGVSRRGVEPLRRLLWRVVTPLLGFMLLLPLIGSGGRLGSTGGEVEASAGVVLVLVGVSALLPWLVDAVTRRLGGGPLSWLLAMRRLRADHGTSGRVVSAIALAVAGAIALQTVFSAADARADRNAASNLGRDSLQIFGARLHDPDAAGSLIDALHRSGDVTAAVAVSNVGLTSSDPISIAPCRVIRLIVDAGRCDQRSTFIVRSGSRLRPGQELRVAGRSLRIPRSARYVALRSGMSPSLALSSYLPVGTLLLAPRAAAELGLDARVADASVALNPRVADAEDRVRDAVARLDPVAEVESIAANPPDHVLAQLQNVLVAGATAVLIVIGGSLIVAVAEQLRERRRVLAVLGAFGARHATLALSVVWQNVLPVAFGLLLAVGLGISLGDVLMHIVGLEAHFDWGAIALLAAAGAAVVAIVTGVTLPMLWRQMRPEALRVE